MVLSKENEQSMLQRLKPPDGFRENFFKDSVREGPAGVWSTHAQFLDGLASKWSLKYLQSSGFSLPGV